LDEADRADAAHLAGTRRDVSVMGDMDSRVTRITLTVLVLLALVTTFVLAQPPTPPGPPRVPPDPTDRRALTVTKGGTGTGTVTGPGITCGADCTEQYIVNTTTVIHAAPAVGSTFTGWSGGGCSGTGSCSVTMSQAQNVTATFTVQIFALSVQKAGTGTGTVTSTPTGISCGTDCTQDYAYATSVTLAQSAGAGSSFAGWSGGCTGTGACVVSMTQARTVNATFSSAAFPLTVTKAGTGSGTVTSAPVGINCGADCTESYAGDTSVTLSQSALSGSTFSGWSGGGCSGTGACVVTMNQALTVTATFTPTTPVACVGPDYAAVSAAVAAAAPGSTVNVCGGVATWSQSLSPASKYLTLKGAGAGTPTQCDVPNQRDFTCITRGDRKLRTISWTTIDSPAGTVSRITGFTFRCFLANILGSAGELHGAVAITGNSSRFRLDHNYFAIGSSPVLHMTGNVRGVVDHNTFNNATRTAGSGSNTLVTTHTKWAGDTYISGGGSWASPPTFGTTDAVYYEDNVILPTATSWDDGAGGSRVVHRFNRTTNVIISSGHGTETVERGRVQSETYFNRLDWSISTQPLIGGRSSSHIVFNNWMFTSLSGANMIEGAQYFRFMTPTQAPPYGAALVREITSLIRVNQTVTGTTKVNHRLSAKAATYQSWIRIRNSSVAAYNATAPWPIETTPTSTTFTFTVSGTPADDTSGLALGQAPYDQDTPLSFLGAHGYGAYPGVDMNCWGAPAAGTPPLTGNNPALPFGFPGQVLVGCLYWKNVRGPTKPNILVPGFNNSGSLVQSDRELWNQNTTGCNTPTSGCTSGIGVGTFENRPTQCTPKNVGPFYWAENQGTWRTRYGSTNIEGLPETTPYTAPSGKLYRCSATNTWTPYYGPNNATGEPLEYPHPLTKIP
jgi:hypothetical protein